MNKIRLFVALVAACILVMPALCMPNEMRQDQKQCDCPNFMKDCTHAQMGHGQDDNGKAFDCQMSMMGDGKLMGQGQDGKEKAFDCQKSMMGDGKLMGQSQDGKEKAFGGQKSMMGDGKLMGQDHKHIKSMMGDKGREDKTEIKIVIINVNT